MPTCGMCLCCCCCDIATGDESLLERARFPCDRRPMQLHNTALALSALSAAGVPLGALPGSGGVLAARAEHLVDGDRERTLSLLWAVARRLQLDVLLRPVTLRAEVARVLARVRALGCTPLPALAAAGAAVNANAAAPLALYMNDELLALLLEWASAVGRAYGVTIGNFTSSFADGVALCLLVRLLPALLMLLLLLSAFSSLRFHLCSSLASVGSPAPPHPLPSARSGALLPAKRSGSGSHPHHPTTPPRGCWHHRRRGFQLRRRR